jgi:S-adenosylmethionine hydrolase
VSLRLPDDQVRTAHRVTTFAEVATGRVGLVVDSYGLVAIVTDRSSAAEALGLHPGAGVRLSPAR